MKMSALAIISALALPTVAFAQTAKDGDKPSMNSTDPSTSTSKPTTGDSGNAAKLGDGDTKIIAHLHHVNQAEIDMGKLAQKSGTAAIKTYAQTLVSDHTSGDKDLTAFGKKHGVAAIPAEKPMTDSDRQDAKDMTAHVAHLKTLKGAEFDKEFLTMMASAHDKELTNIDTSIAAAQNTDLQDLLKATKPVLQRHADQARDLQKGPQASSPSGAMNPSDSSMPSASPSTPPSGPTTTSPSSISPHAPSSSGTSNLPNDSSSSGSPSLPPPSSPHSPN